MDPIIVFTDGSCLNNGKSFASAGYAVVFPDFPDLDFAAKLDTPCTNNRAEFSACIKAIEICNDCIDKDRPIKLYTDSQLLIKTMTNYIKKWKKNNWVKSDKKPVCNIDLVTRLDVLTQSKNIEWIYVEAHTGKDDWTSKMNEKVDKMAKSANFL